MKMSGVEILATEEVAVAWESWNWEGFLVTVGICFLVAIVAGILAGVSDDWELGVIIFLIVFIAGSALFGTLIGCTTGEPIECEIQYKVVIDDSVSMNEFLEKYKIIDQEGKIYTVREKN
jgi:hypothetical protein